MSGCVYKWKQTARRVSALVKTEQFIQISSFEKSKNISKQKWEEEQVDQLDTQLNKTNLILKANSDGW